MAHADREKPALAIQHGTDPCTVALARSFESEVSASGRSISFRIVRKAPDEEIGQFLRRAGRSPFWVNFRPCVADDGERETVQEFLYQRQKSGYGATLDISVPGTPGAQDQHVLVEVERFMHHCRLIDSTPPVCPEDEIRERAEQLHIAYQMRELTRHDRVWKRAVVQAHEAIRQSGEYMGDRLADGRYQLQQRERRRGSFEQWRTRDRKKDEDVRLFLCPLARLASHPDGDALVKRLEVDRRQPIQREGEFAVYFFPGDVP